MHALLWILYNIMGLLYTHLIMCRHGEGQDVKALAVTRIPHLSDDNQ